MDYDSRRKHKKKFRFIPPSVYAGLLPTTKQEVNHIAKADVHHSKEEHIKVPTDTTDDKTLAVANDSITDTIFGSGANWSKLDSTGTKLAHRLDPAYLLPMPDILKKISSPQPGIYLRPGSHNYHEVVMLLMICSSHTVDGKQKIDFSYFDNYAVSYFQANL